MSQFAVIGDATLDVTVIPSRPPREGGDIPATIRLAPGGQGANVAVRLARLGAPVALVAAVGDDAAGRILRETLASEGVELVERPAAHSALVVALLDARGERTMLSDRRALAADAAATVVRDASWIHVSGYALLDDQHAEALAVVVAGRDAGARLSVAGGSIPPDATVAERFRSRVAVARPDLVLLSRDEAGALLGSAAGPLPDAASGLRDLAPLVIVTGGSQGSAAAVGGSVLEVPAPEPTEPMTDATGSGDAYLAALVLALANAQWPPSQPALRSAMEAGSAAGSQVARVLGAQARIPAEGLGVRG